MNWREHAGAGNPCHSRRKMRSGWRVEANMMERCFDVAHLGHVEMYTDKFEESLDFFTRVYGLKLSGRDDTSAYLRAWDDYEFSTLKLTKSDTTGIGHVAYRVSSRSEEHTSELQSLMRISYAVFCLKKKNTIPVTKTHNI